MKRVIKTLRRPCPFRRGNLRARSRIRYTEWLDLSGGLMGADDDYTKRPNTLERPATKRQDVDRFLERVQSTVPTHSGETTHPRGRLLFALDATGSRAPTWERASHLQAHMFQAVEAHGGLDVKVCFYRGYGEFQATRWSASPERVRAALTGIRCRGGLTQIARVLELAEREAAHGTLDAVAFIGDCCEESIDELSHRAGRLGVQGVPVLVFQEGNEPTATRIFAEIARLSGGAHCRFDPGSAETLTELLSGAAVFAAGGARALRDYSQGRGSAVAALSRQLRGPGPHDAPGR